MKSPSCFISYSWDDDAHKVWVRKLAETLQSAGIKIYLDQWDMFPGVDLLHYMESKVRQSDFIVAVCTPEFARKVDDAKGGAGWEKSVIAGEMFYAARAPGKCIPILRSGTPKTSLPSYLISRLFIDFRDDARFSKACSELTSHILKKPLRRSIATDGMRKPVIRDVPSRSRRHKQESLEAGTLLSIGNRKLGLNLASRAALDPKMVFLRHCERVALGESIRVGWCVRLVPFLNILHFAYLQQLSRFAAFGFRVQIVLYDLCTALAFNPRERKLLCDLMVRRLRKFQHIDGAEILILSAELEKQQGADVFAELFEIARLGKTLPGSPNRDAATTLDGLICLTMEQRLGYDILLCGGIDASAYWLQLRQALSRLTRGANPLIVEFPTIGNSLGVAPLSTELLPNERDDVHTLVEKLRRVDAQCRETYWQVLVGPALAIAARSPRRIGALAKELASALRVSRSD